MKRWPVVALVLINVLVAITTAWPALAQNSVLPQSPMLPQGPDTVWVPTVGEFLRQGVLGALCVLEGFVIYVLYKQVQASNAKFVEMAVKQTEIFAETARVLKRNEELLEKANDQKINDLLQKLLDKLR